MSHLARLITPDGKSIELSPDVYQQVRRLLTNTRRRQSRAKLDEAIRATYGKYAGGPSLTQALLNEHAAERRREAAKSSRRHVRLSNTPLAMIQSSQTTRPADPAKT